MGIRCYYGPLGITRVGTKEAERFEEDLDSTEYRDATEEPTQKEETEELRSEGIQGGFGSSSLKECMELLNAIPRAPLDSGVGRKTTVPSQVTSPSVEGSLAEADTQASNDSVSQATSQVKDEPQSRIEHDSVEETKSDGHMPTLDVKSEQKESEGKEEATTSVKQEERTPEPDSEDSITAERVAEELHRLSGTQGPRVSAHAPPNAEEEANSSQNDSQRKSVRSRRL